MRSRSGKGEGIPELGACATQGTTGGATIIGNAHEARNRGMQLFWRIGGDYRDRDDCGVGGNYRDR